MFFACCTCFCLNLTKQRLFHNVNYVTDSKWKQTVRQEHEQSLQTLMMNAISLKALIDNPVYLRMQMCHYKRRFIL